MMWSHTSSSLATSRSLSSFWQMRATRYVHSSARLVLRVAPQSEENCIQDVHMRPHIVAHDSRQRQLVNENFSGQLSSCKGLHRQVRIAYESAAETAESADDGSKTGGGASLKAPTERS